MEGQESLTYIDECLSALSSFGVEGREEMPLTVRFSRICFISSFKEVTEAERAFKLSN